MGWSPERLSWAIVGLVFGVRWLVGKIHSFSWLVDIFEFEAKISGRCPFL